MLAAWEPLPDTKGITLPEWVVDTVLDHVAKENKATAGDGVSVTLWKRVPTARRICKALVRLMWCYELPAGEALLCLQVMVHKAGKGWGQRKFFRPITLCNDLYKTRPRRAVCRCSCGPSSRCELGNTRRLSKILTLRPARSRTWRERSTVRLPRWP